MIVFFEDGSINNKNLCVNNSDALKVDAGLGFSRCRERLKYIDKNYPFDTIVYTNSLDAFSSTWCWNKTEELPMIYVRNEENEWRLISKLTNRKLRRSMNLEKLYINGEFGFVTT